MIYVCMIIILCNAFTVWVYTITLACLPASCLVASPALLFPALLHSMSLCSYRDQSNRQRVGCSTWWVYHPHHRQRGMVYMAQWQLLLIAEVGHNRVLAVNLSTTTNESKRAQMLCMYSIYLCFYLYLNIVHQWIAMEVVTGGVPGEPKAALDWLLIMILVMCLLPIVITSTNVALDEL